MRNVVGITGNTTPRQWPGWSASGSPQQSIVYWALLLGQKIILSIGERYPTHAHVHLDVVLAELGKMKVLEISPLIRNSLHSALRKAFFFMQLCIQCPIPWKQRYKDQTAVSFCTVSKPLFWQIWGPRSPLSILIQALIHTWLLSWQLSASYLHFTNLVA